MLSLASNEPESHQRIGVKLAQEFIAEMLGTRRATVSIGAMVLQNEGLIQNSRGHIKIVDRPGLEAFTCECYQATRN